MSRLADVRQLYPLLAELGAGDAAGVELPPVLDSHRLYDARLVRIHSLRTGSRGHFSRSPSLSLPAMPPGSPNVAQLLRDAEQLRCIDPPLEPQHHPEDRRCVQVYAGYRALLCDGDDTVSAIALDQLVDAWSRVVEPSARTAWLEPFRTRYLDLEQSAS